MGFSEKYLPRLASNLDPPDLCSQSPHVQTPSKARMCPWEVQLSNPPTTQRREGDSRQHSKGDQRGGQAEHGQRAADVTDGRQRHLVSVREL
jgi:hypothetical protein